MPESSCWHTILVTKTHDAPLALLHLVRIGNELTLITVFARIIRTFFVAVSVQMCVVENFTRPRPRPRT